MGSFFSIILQKNIFTFNIVTQMAIPEMCCVFELKDIF